MFTVCPKCALTLVVTAADLRVAQGYVRCGRCSNVFNALNRLSEDRQGASPQSSPASDPQSAESAGTPASQQPARAPEPKRYDDNTAEEDLEFNPDSADLSQVFVEPPDNPQFKAASGTFKALRLEAESGARPSGPADPQSAEDAADEPPIDHVEAAAGPHELDSTALPGEEPKSTPGAIDPAAALPPAAATEDIDASAQARAPESPAQAAKSTDTAFAPSPTATNPTSTTNTTDEDAQATAARRREDAISKMKAKRSSAVETAHAIRDAMLPRKRTVTTTEGIPTRADPTIRVSPRVWLGGSAGLLVILLIQVVHHYRHDLAATSALNGPLTSVYRTLGIQVVPRWDLTTYEVRQLGAATAPETPGDILVRASVKNGAHQAQPLPLLRVTMQDRFGNRIASRDVPPQSYLPRAIPVSSLLSAGQRIDAEMAFVDPGADAVGFEIDACLPAPGGGISCANDIAR